MAKHLGYQFGWGQFEDDLGLGRLPSGVEIEDRRCVAQPIICSVGTSKGPLLVGWIEAERGSIVSQIAVRLSIEAMLDCALGVTKTNKEERDATPIASRIVREGFKEANRQVYEYAHRMAAGGKAAARGFIASFDGQRFTIGKVGLYASYLFREHKLVPLHEPEAHEESKAGTLQRFVGANAQILVDLASTQVADGDIVILTTLPHSEELSNAVRFVLDGQLPLERACKEIIEALAPFALVPNGENKYVLERSPAVVCLQIGRPVIQLKHVLRCQ